MNIHLDDDLYEELGATFQVVLIDIINRALKDDVPNSETRKEICGQVMFELGNVLDQCGITENDRTFYPVVGFSSVFLNGEAELPAEGDLYLQGSSFSHHEYAGGDVYYYFDEHDESVPDVAVTPVGGDDA